MIFRFILVLSSLLFTLSAEAGVLSASNVQISWHVVNRFRFFRDPALFAAQERAYLDYARRLAPRSGSAQDTGDLLDATAVRGTEQVLNDRFIPFTQSLRPDFDWQGWAARAYAKTCYDSEKRGHEACGGIDNYLNPAAHEIEIGLEPRDPDLSLASFTCHWQVGDSLEQVERCDRPIHALVPSGDTTTVSVNLAGEPAISLDVAVRDLLVVGLGDSFASGEGNPDVPVALSATGRVQSLYPARAIAGAQGSARWQDRLCHRSLYSYQLRAALQMAIENPHGSVTYLGYACSGAAIENGLIGPQSYVEYHSDDARSANPRVAAISGGRSDGQIPRLLSELCKVPPVFSDGLWTCPNNEFRRTVDYLLLSVGGNDIGFSGMVNWTILRRGPLTSLAGLFGVTVSPDQFQSRMDRDLGPAYERLAQQFQKAIPLGTGGTFDPSRVILSAYPDILSDETGEVCQGVSDGAAPEDSFAANQGMDRFVNWLVVKQERIDAAHSELEALYAKMADAAKAHGWTFAGRAHAAKPFRNHGFCAQDPARLDDPAEALIVPCWGKAARPTLSCQSGIFGQGTGWRPYDPASQNYPYALRQRWVRTVNDAYMTINQKIADRFGVIDEASSERDFSETTGAMHPNAQGEAALADALLFDLRPTLPRAAEAQ